MIDDQTTLRELAFLVCTALERAGATAVLTGGSAAACYAPQAYVSQDMDFVLSFLGRTAKETVLNDLGFRRQGSMYVHPRSPITLDFPEGPLAVGEEILRKWETWREGDRLLHILTPTDCVRDRLAGYLFWNDRQNLATAVAVAKARRKEIDLPYIRQWCEAEGERPKFEDFLAALSR